MKAFFLAGGYLFFAAWLEPTLAHWLWGLSPNLIFLGTFLFALRWRGPEVHFLAALFGLVADCFSSLFFGINGFVLLLWSFPFRWFALRSFQGSALALPIASGVAMVMIHFSIWAVAYSLNDVGPLSLHWFNQLFLFEIIPTAVCASPLLLLLIRFERRWRIRLFERKFCEKSL